MRFEPEDAGATVQAIHSAAATAVTTDAPFNRSRQSHSPNTGGRLVAVHHVIPMAAIAATPTNSGTL